jgi:hypothetical protein
MSLLTKGKTNWKYILIVVILSILVGGGILVYLRYFEKEIVSISQFPEIKKPIEVSMEEQELAKEAVNGYVKALISRQKDNVLPYLTGEAKKKVQEWPPIFGTSNPHLGSFEILSIKKLDTIKFEFIVREYQEYTGEGIIGYNDETLIVEKINGRYLISKIETSEYINIKETAHWKTYRNLKWNYEIKYPRNFYAMDVYEGDTGAISNVELPEYEEGSITWMGREVVVFGAKNGILVTINYAGKTEKPLEKWLKKEYPQLDLSHYKSVYIAEENALLNRKEFYNECLSGSLGECESENAPRGNFIDYDIYLLKDSNIFNIKAQIKMENKEYDTIFNQILSTFRFLK